MVDLHRRDGVRNQKLEKKRYNDSSVPLSHVYTKEKKYNVESLPFTIDSFN